MGYKKINLSFAILMGFFVIGILFASSYSANKTKLATLSLTKSQINSIELAQKISKFKGIKTVFLDSGTKLLTFRYDPSKLSLTEIKKRLKKKGILVEKLNSIQIIPSKKKSKVYQDNNKIFQLNFSSAISVSKH